MLLLELPLICDFVSMVVFYFDKANMRWVKKVVSWFGKLCAALAQTKSVWSKQGSIVADLSRYTNP